MHARLLAVLRHALIALVAGAGAAAPAQTTVRARDILVQARADRPVDLQSWGNVQCDGRILPPAAVPPDGLHGRPLPGGQTLRFGRVPDPADPSGHALRFTLDAGDPPTAGSYRCELAFAADAAQGLPRRTAFWHAFTVWLPDLRGTDDEQAIAQWHAGDASGLLPVYTLLLRGAELRLVLRHDSSAVPMRGSTQVKTLWRSMAWAPQRWLRFVTQARLSIDPADDPFVRTWLDGVPIVDHRGPAGYALGATQPYAKHGLYHWVDASNPWHPAARTRTVYLKRALLVADTAQAYSHDVLDAALLDR